MTTLLKWLVCALVVLTASSAMAQAEEAPITYRYSIVDCNLNVDTETLDCANVTYQSRFAPNQVIEIGNWIAAIDCKTGADSTVNCADYAYDPLGGEPTCEGVSALIHRYSRLYGGLQRVQAEWPFGRLLEAATALGCMIPT